MMTMSTYPTPVHHHHPSQFQQPQHQQQQQHGGGGHGSSSSTTTTAGAAGYSALDLDLGALSLHDAPQLLQQQHQQHQQYQQQQRGRPLPSDLPPPSSSSSSQHHHHQLIGDYHPLPPHSNYLSSAAAAGGGAPLLSGAHAFQPQPYGASTAPPHHPLHQTHKLDTPRRRGVVKFFNSLKGFGFVVDNEPGALGGQEVFCHFSAISGKGGFRSLAEGEEVEYELVQGPKGFQAANLTGPAGRTVVGDPKARLAKPPPYMPFAPLTMPLGSQFISADPYSQQAVFAASPYTQHVVYVPTSVAVPPGQYGSYGGSLGSARESRQGSSPFGPSYSFAPPGPVTGAPGSSSNTSGASPSRGGPGSDSDRYSSSLSAQTNYPSSRGGAPSSSTSYGTNQASGFGGTQRDNGSPREKGNGNGNGGLSFGFAPFSPPSAQSQLPLFEDGVRAPRSFESRSTPPPPAPSQSSLNRPSSRGNLMAGASGSSVNGGGGSHSSGASVNGAAFDALRPPPIGSGSRSNTPASRGTPLGNGLLSGSEWKSSPVLYTSASQGTEY